MEQNIVKLLEKDFEIAFNDRYKTLVEVEFSNIYAFKNLVSLFKNKIEWTGSESISLTSTYIKLNDLMLNLEVVESDKIVIKIESLFIDRILYFLNKYKSKGVNLATDFVNMYAPIASVYNTFKEKEQTLQKLQGEINEYNMNGTIPLRYRTEES